MDTETKVYIKAICRFGREDWAVGVTSVFLFLFATAISENFNSIYNEYFLGGSILAFIFVILVTLLHRLVTIERQQAEKDKAENDLKEKSQMQTDIKSIEDGILRLEGTRIETKLREYHEQVITISERNNERTNIISSIVGKFNQGLLNEQVNCVDNEVRQRDLWNSLLTEILILEEHYLDEWQKNSSHVVNEAIQELKNMPIGPRLWNDNRRLIKRILATENSLNAQILLELPVIDDQRVNSPTTSS